MFSTSYIVVDPPSRFDREEDLQRALAFLRSLGFDGAELNIADPLGVDIDHLEGWVDDLDLALPSFMTGGAYADGLCLSSPDLSVRKRTVARLISYIETARRFDAVLAVGLLQGLRTDEPDAEVANDRIVECFREIAPAAEESGVQFVLEPVNHLQVGFNNSVKEVLAIIERVGSPALKPMVDTLHMNIEESSPMQCIFDVGADLRHVHFCDSNGGLLGSGNVDLAAAWDALQRIDYERFVSVKVYRCPVWQEAAQSAMEYLKGLPWPIGSGEGPGEGHSVDSRG